MHPFPAAPDLAFLWRDDRALTQIIVDPYGLTLVLDSGVKFVCEEALTYIGVNDGRYRYEKEWRNEEPILFHTLLERDWLASTEQTLS